MSPSIIMEKIQACQQALTAGNTQLKTLGVKKADAERKYRVELRKELLRLRQLEKQPVTLIKDLAKGKEDIAALRLNRDITKSAYYTAISAMENLRVEIETLRSMLCWLREEYKNSGGI